MHDFERQYYCSLKHSSGGAEIDGEGQNSPELLKLCRLQNPLVMYIHIRKGVPRCEEQLAPSHSNRQDLYANHWMGNVKATTQMVREYVFRFLSFHE